MEFNSNKAIYLQISDMICDQILSGALAADDRIPSVREYGASVGVNPNTVMRTYEKLTNEGIIYNKRGIGYFISAEAKDIVPQRVPGGRAAGRHQKNGAPRARPEGAARQKQLGNLNI